MSAMMPVSGTSSPRGLLQINSPALQRQYNADPTTGKVEIVEYLVLGNDSTQLWAAYYPTVNAYSTDMRDLLLERRWMLEFSAKEEGGPEAAPGTYIFDLPFRIPDWARRIGVDKPKLTINGSYKLVTAGSRKSGSGVPYTGSWFPSLTLDQQPAFAVKGTIGRLITVEINSEEGLGNNLRDQMKISYRGEGDELEDDIIQEIEAGNTSLSLTGTNLTGYTENHRGLFGIKMRMKVGNLEVTTIASQEGGSQERQKLGTSTVERDFPIEDKNIDFFRHFWLSLEDRAAYANPANWVGNAPVYTTGALNRRRPVEVFQLLNGAQDPTVRGDSAQACAYNELGQKTTVCVTGRWRTLVEGTDFTYDEALRLLSVPGGFREITLSVRWQGDHIEELTGDVRRDPFNKILIYSRNHRDNPDLEPLMWRNVYNVGRVSAQDRDNFKIRVVDNTPTEVSPDTNVTYVRLLGLEKTSEVGKLDIDNPFVFKLEQGYLILPCLSNGYLDRDPGNCLTPMKRVRPEVALYSTSIEEVQNGPTASRFLVFGKQRKSSFDVRENSFAAGGQQCYDINPNTERIVLNGSTVLRRGLDYEVVYETGQITLTSARARDPNAELDISYECDPPFQIQDKVLLGTRMEYKLDNISEQSLIGATILYKSQTTTEQQPELGYEPFSHVLMGMNTRLAGEPKWMTRFANLFPFVQTEAPSRANFEFEIAHSIYNPNTKNTAYVDNFDFSQNVSSLPLMLYNWTRASPPLFGSDGRPDETLDFRHQGQLVWHSSFTEQYYQIYGNTGNSYTNSREQTLLKFQFQPNDNLEGNSWGGIMRAFPQGLSDHSRKRTLEIVVQGREGTLYADLGRISEDISIPGIQSGEPDGQLQSEVNEFSGDYVNRRDAGLDGVLSSEGETGVRWECKPSCFATPIPPDNLDPGLDNWDDPDAGSTRESYVVNGTEGNNKGSEGVAYDSEDLDRSGTLDTLNRFLRFSMPLDSLCEARFNCEPLRNGWRKYRIPLYGGGARIDPSNTETEQSILSNGKMLRLWLGKLPKRVSSTELLLARVNIVGNTWEEGDRSTAYEISDNRYCSGDLGDSACINMPPSVRDSNNLRVDVINRQEERGYRQSPNTPQERDTRTDEPLPERALVLRYENLHPGEVVHATRLLPGDAKDFTRYDRMSLEVHGDSSAVPGGNPGQGKVRFGLRLGKDQGNRDSKDYYEVRLHMDTTAELDPEHKALWQRNSFTVRLSDLTGLKNDPLYRAFAGRPVTQPAFHQGRSDSSLEISVVGNPNLGAIDWMRLVIYVDSGATQNQQGEIWVNDLRLEGVDRTGGTAIRSQIQLDFADFINISANLTYTNGNFTTMSETKRTPANSKTIVDYNSTVTLFANKFMPDEWGVALPVTLTHNGAMSRPFTRPFSDLELGGTGLFDISRDLIEGRLSSIHNAEDSLRDIDDRYARVYQTTDFQRIFSTSYRKEMRSKNFFTRTLLERPGMEYRYAGSEHVEYYRDDETRSYTYRLTYNLSPKEVKTYKPLDSLARRKYVPDFIADFSVTPLPEKVNLVIADYSFVRSQTINKPVDDLQVVPVTPTVYNVDMAHAFDFEWRPFNFLNFGYRLDVNRDFDLDRECFDRESFFAGTCENGRSARSLLLSFDDERMGAGFDPATNTDTTHRGDRYGILARERNRTQSFHADFTAAPLSWLSSGAGFNSGYRHTWVNAQEATFGGTSKPAHFESSADHEIRLTSGVNPAQVLGSLGSTFKGLAKGMDAARKAVETYRVRNLDLTYTVSNRYNGEAFTYDYLQEKGVGFGALTAYQFGFVYDPTNLGTIFKGEPNPRFFDYLSEPDLALGQATMNHVVNRGVDLQSGFSVPPLFLDLTGGLKYSKQYTLYRYFQASDTTVVWPEYTVAGNFNDFAAKIPFVRDGLRSLTAYTNYNYREESRFGAFSPLPDVDKYAHRFAPLLRLTGTAKNDMRIEISFNAAYETEIQYGKAPDSNQARPLTYLGDEQLPQTVYVRDPSKQSPRRTLACGVEPTLSWDLETQKGIQFWRYYVRLKNNLRLTLNGAANYLRTESEQNGIKFRERDEVNTRIKPEATYNFTNNVDAKFFAEYIYTQLFHTANNEYTHEVALHGEFTMRF